MLKATKYTYAFRGREAYVARKMKKCKSERDDIVTWVHGVFKEREIEIKREREIKRNRKKSCEQETLLRVCVCMCFQLRKREG